MLFLLKIGFLEVGFVDLAEVVVLTFLFYQLYRLVRGTVALKVFVGSVGFYICYLIFKTLGMELLTAIFGRVVGVGVISLIVLFQPEIRRFLLMLSRSSFIDTIFSMRIFPAKASHYDISPVIEAIKNMASTYTGAIIVFTRTSDLRYYTETGEVLDAAISRKLLLSIFNKYSPLHDGAVIVSDGKIKAARCILPVSESDDLPTNLGLRHRSALGISENSDCLVIVSSEETGKISIADYGQLYYDVPENEIHAKLSRLLFPPSASVLKQSAKLKPRFQFS
jgi:diadenylate cyclase